MGALIIRIRASLNGSFRCSRRGCQKGSRGVWYRGVDDLEWNFIGGLPTLVLCPFVL